MNLYLYLIDIFLLNYKKRMFVVYIDPKKSEIADRVGFDSEADLMKFIMEYIKHYYPNFINTGKNNEARREHIYSALCSIQKRKDNNYKILEIESNEN